MSNPAIDPIPRRDANDEVPAPSSLSGQAPNSSDFWRHKSLDELAAEQGVQPIEDVDGFLAEIGDVWPDDESADEFVAWLRRLRREGRDS